MWFLCTQHGARSCKAYERMMAMWRKYGLMKIRQHFQNKFNLSLPTSLSENNSWNSWYIQNFLFPRGNYLCLFTSRRHDNGQEKVDGILKIGSRFRANLTDKKNFGGLMTFRNNLPSLLFLRKIQISLSVCVGSFPLDVKYIKYVN